MNSTYAQKSSTVQKAAAPNAASVLDSSAQNESLQRKADMANSAAQRAEAPRPNNTGMPDNLKAGIESLSGFSMDDVRVHYNSSKPATVQALAYTQGTDIHVAPGQEKHLPHEAWHVAQQMAGRVSPTTNINGLPVNDNAGLEHEADVMGEKAVMQRKGLAVDYASGKVQGSVAQRMAFYNPASSTKTKQYEGKNLFGRSAGSERSPELAALVDLFKKEMLTLIATKIGKQIEKTGPHISVAITGGKCYIAINTKKTIFTNENPFCKGVDPETISALSTAGDFALNEIGEEYEMVKSNLKKQYSTDDIEKIDFEEKCKGDATQKAKYLREQALYIAYRWANRCKGSVFVTNKKNEISVLSTDVKVAKKDARSKHGEMQTIDYLNGKCGEISLDWKSDKPHIDGLRVVRIGGTKTPCFDCADEIYNDGRAHGKGEGNYLHSFVSTPDGALNRRVVTMTDAFGDAFNNWHDGYWTRTTEKTSVEHGFDSLQDQSSVNLLDSFLRLCDDESVISKINQEAVDRLKIFDEDVRVFCRRIIKDKSTADETIAKLIWLKKRGKNVDLDMRSLINNVDADCYKSDEKIMIFFMKSFSAWLINSFFSVRNIPTLKEDFEYFGSMQDKESYENPALLLMNVRVFQKNVEKFLDKCICIHVNFLHSSQGPSSVPANPN